MQARHLIGALAAGILLAPACDADVARAAPEGFVIEHRFVIEATPAEAWDALVHPERYWPDDHTWSGDSSHLSLLPEAGGCFCERWSEGSAEHGRVVMAIPAKLLRFRGSLGPFQEMAVTGVMTVTLAPRGRGTEAVVTYRLGGDPSQRLGEMATVVDGVVRKQFEGFAALASRRPE